MLTFLIALTRPINAVPIQMTHQGRLLDANGAAETGLHLLTFTLYDAETGGSSQWTETLAVQFNNGYYATILGSDEQNNPLDSSTLEFYPLYLEIAVDQGIPLSPRSPVVSVPYSQISGLSETAVTLDGGSVNATEVFIAGQSVIDPNGEWVGPAINVAWNNIDSSTIPSGLSDGDDDTLGDITCAIGEIITWSGAGWTCTSDSRLTLSDVQSYLQSTPVSLNTDTTLNGVPILTTVDDSDTLATLSCSDGDVALYDLVLGEWVCSPSPTLSETEVETYIENDPINLSSNSTMNGEPLIATPPACSNGQILSYDQPNNTWNCIDFASVLDADGDGVFAWLDCDDNDPNLLDQSTDADCDGFEAVDDCDDTDASVGDGGTGSSPDCLAQSCKTILDDGYSTGDGVYYLDLGGSSQAVYCDMTTDGGGWSILYAATGANSEVILTSNSSRNGNPLSFQHHNLARSAKVELSNASSETLYKRNNGTWMKANAAPFTSALLNSNQQSYSSVTLTSSNGTTTNGFQGWSNFNHTGGGDYYVTMTDGNTCSGTTVNGVDNHSNNYYLLNCGCVRHYLYSYSNANADNDAGYDASVALGDWGITAVCDSAEGGSLQFFVAVR